MDDAYQLPSTFVPVMKIRLAYRYENIIYKGFITGVRKVMQYQQLWVPVYGDGHSRWVDVSFDEGRRLRMLIYEIDGRVLDAIDNQ